MIGGIITITANGGIVALPQEVIMNKYRKFQSICVSSPITPFIYYMGVSLSRFFYILPPLFIISFMLGISGLLSNLMLYILIILFIFLIGSMLGFAIATHLSNPMYIGAIANMLGLLLCLLPPVYYPLTLIPSQYRLIIMLVPTVSAAHLMRIALGIVDASMGELVSLFSVLLIYLIVSIFLVKEKAEWREK
jgi:ABC-2 type transport system permease protein